MEIYPVLHFVLKFENSSSLFNFFFALQINALHIYLWFDGNTLDISINFRLKSINPKMLKSTIALIWNGPILWRGSASMGFSKSRVEDLLSDLYDEFLYTF